MESGLIAVVFFRRSRIAHCSGMPVPVIKSNETGYYIGKKRKQDFCALNIVRSTAQLINQSDELEWLGPGSFSGGDKAACFPDSM